MRKIDRVFKKKLDYSGFFLSNGDFFFQGQF